MMVAAVVPTMNEADNIGSFVRALTGMCDRVIVADGSTDSTAEIAADAGARVLNVIGGLDEAYWFAHATIEANWWVVHVDAGRSHRLQDVTHLLDAGAKYEYDLTIGSRFCPGARYDGRPARRLMSRVAAMAMNRACGTDFYDWTSGLRLYSPKARTVIRNHVFRATGHAWQIESLWACHGAGCATAEIPITYRAGTSHMSVQRAWEAVRLIGRVTWL